MGWKDDEVVQDKNNSSWKDDEIVPTSYMQDVGKNAAREIKEFPSSIPSTVKAGLGVASAPMDALKSIPQMMGGKSFSETSLGEDVEPIIQGNKGTLQTIEHPVESFRNAPINTAMTAAGLFGAAKGMMPGEKPPVLPTEEPITAPPETVPLRSIPEPKFQGASQVPPDPNAPPIPPIPPVPEAPATPKNPILEAKDYVNSAIPKAKDFLNAQYAKQAKDPGWANTMAQYLQQESQNLAAKEMGASSKHVRQIGEEGVQALGQYAIDKKLIDPRVGSIGMKERVNSINKTAGKVSGDIRKEADTLFNPTKDTIDVLQPVRQILDKDFEPGMPGANEYKTAIGLVEKSDPSPSGVAELATKLNRLANENNKLKQPSRPYTDVANIVSRINNDRIKGLIGTEKSAIYDEALKDFGATKKLKEFLKNKAARGMSSGSAGSATNRIVQKFLETAGYKAGSRIAGGMAKKILASPKTAGSLPEMFKEFINQVEALDDDIAPPGMAHGGVVPDIDDAVFHHLRKENDSDYRKWAQGC